MNYNTTSVIENISAFFLGNFEINMKVTAVLQLVERKSLTKCCLL